MASLIINQVGRTIEMWNNVFVKNLVVLLTTLFHNAFASTHFIV